MRAPSSLLPLDLLLPCYFSLSLTKFLQLLNLAIFATLSLFNLLAVPAPHLLSFFLAPLQPSPPWKSHIAHLVMHHLVFGINFQIHSVSFTIVVSIHLLIHFSTHLCHHPHSRHPSLLHVIVDFTLSLQAQNLPFQQIRSTVDFVYLLDCLTITGLDRTYHAHHFIFSFAF